MAVTVSEAGRRGGLTVLQKHGRQFYVEIGRKGQAATRRKYPGKATQWGAMGGRPRKLPLDAMGERQAKNNRKEVADPPSSRLSPLSKYSSKIDGREATMRTEATPRKPGRPRAIPENRIQEVVSLYERGLGYRAIARELERRSLLVDWSTVRNVIKSRRNRGDRYDTQNSNSNTVLTRDRPQNMS